MMEVSLKDNHCTLILFGKMFIFKQLISNRKLLSAVHWQMCTCPLIFRHNFTIKSARNCDRAVAESDRVEIKAGSVRFSVCEKNGKIQRR